MGKQRVQLHQRLGYAVVDEGATKGAVVGVNLFNGDGTLYVPPVASTPAPGSPAVTFWRLVQEIPPNIQGLASLTGTGVVRRVGTGTFGTDAGLNDLSDVDAPSPGLGDVLWFDGHDWVPTKMPTGGVLPLATGEILNDQPVLVCNPDGSLVYAPAEY